MACANVGMVSFPVDYLWEPGNPLSYGDLDASSLGIVTKCDFRYVMLWNLISLCLKPGFRYFRRYHMGTGPYQKCTVQVNSSRSKVLIFKVICGSIFHICNPQIIHLM